jgi:uncharacterized protein (DUF2141 family)
MLNLITIFYLAIQPAILQVNVEKPVGELYLAVYDSEESFMKEAKWRIVEEVKSTSTKIDMPFPEGVYAVAVFQDLNENGKLDKNWMGVPTEPYGFSKDARGTFGPPSFSESSIEYNSKNTFFDLTLR